MTRENKLAVVLGLGFLLLVGILVSDHFSPARLEAAEDLRRGSDPGIAGRTSAWRPHRLHSEASDTPDTPSASPTRPEEPAANPGRPEPPAGPAGLESGRVHRVVAGDTLERIARREYGDAGLVVALARYNRVDDPASIRVGQSLELPPAAVLRQGESSWRSATAEVETAAPSRPWVYVVQEHDTLSGIAVANLGTAKAWTTILELNRDVLPDERSLRAGQELRMPPRDR